MNNRINRTVVWKVIFHRQSEVEDEQLRKNLIYKPINIKLYQDKEAIQGAEERKIPSIRKILLIVSRKYLCV